jgi:hypothetical protein
VRRRLSIIITEFFSHFRGEYSSAKKALLWVNIQSIGIGMFFNFCLWVYFRKILNIGINWTAILVFCATTFTIAWLRALLAQWHDLPLNILHDAYKDMTKRSPELVGLINSSVFGALAKTHFHLLRLALLGDEWTPDIRFGIATSLIEGFKKVERYYATSTDIPYMTLDAALQFYAVSEKILRGALVQRLLVFPKATLFEDLESNEDDRKNLLAFIDLNHHHGAKRNQQRRGYQLRYWPNKFQALRTNMRRWFRIEEHESDTDQPVLVRGYQLRYWPNNIQALRTNMRRTFRIEEQESDLDQPVLVDMAIVEGNVEERTPFARIGRQLVFGQAGREQDVLVVRGPGMVHGGPFKAAQYKGWFTYVWEAHAGDCESAAQLAYWARLFRLRAEIGKRYGDGAGDHGDVFFANILKSLEVAVDLCAVDLCAVDVAQTTGPWYEASPYIRLHDAMKKSAALNPTGKHAGIFVIPHCLPKWVAEGFIDKVISELLVAGSEVFLYRKRDLVRDDLAAGAHIVADNRCFYLTPNEVLDVHSIYTLSDAKNKAEDDDIWLFRDQFSQLADRKRAWHYCSRENLSKWSDKRQQLIAGLIHHGL